MPFRREIVFNFTSLFHIPPENMRCLCVHEEKKKRDFRFLTCKIIIFFPFPPTEMRKIHNLIDIFPCLEYFQLVIYSIVSEIGFKMRDKEEGESFAMININKNSNFHPFVR